MSNKKLSFIKKISPAFSFITDQEFQIHQLLQDESIPFEFQKTFKINDRRFIVDFLINEKILLECTFSAMKKYQIAFRLKAIQFEEKCSILSKMIRYPIWILFETSQSISPLFQQNLARLIPSVDSLYFSRWELLESLQMKLNQGHLQFEVKE